MKKVIAAILLAGCAAPQPRPKSAKVMLGIDVLEAHGFSELRGKTIGLYVNQTSKDSAGRNTWDVLGSAPGVTLAVIFTPEHGIDGKTEEGKVGDETIVVNGRAVRVVSLYKGGLYGMRPKFSDIDRLDALVFDIQDVGARYFSYLTTMGIGQEEAKKAGLGFFVLDRPNPVDGVDVDGPMLDDHSLRNLTEYAYFAEPIRHGMTAGEVARMHNGEIKSDKLTVVPLENWRRAMWFDQTGLRWTPPSPNLPTSASTTLYPALGCFDFTNVSAGRGTPEPFAWVGAPWIDGPRLAGIMNAALLEGVEFEAKDYTPSKRNKTGQLFHGVRVIVKNRDAARPWPIFVHFITAIRDLYPNDFNPNWEMTRRLIGSERFRELYEKGADAEEIIRELEPATRAFEETRKPFLLYD